RGADHGAELRHAEGGELTGATSDEPRGGTELATRADRSAGGELAFQVLPQPGQINGQTGGERCDGKGEEAGGLHESPSIYVNDVLVCVLLRGTLAPVSSRSQWPMEGDRCGCRIRQVRRAHRSTARGARCLP